MSPVAPYGRWPSPLAPAEVAAARLSRSAVASDGRSLWWLESRPEEGGITVLVRGDGGQHPAVVSPPGVSVRSRVHEYGGGAWCLIEGAGEGAFAYVEDRSQQVFAVVPGSDDPVALSAPAPAGERWRHGGLVDAGGQRVLAVRERERPGTGSRSVVLFDLATSTESTVCAGRDFYGSLAVSAAGDRLAWVLWDHPFMPWDETELWVGDLGADGVRGATRVGPEILAGSSVDQPLFGADGSLSFVADAGGWWQPWRLEADGELRRLSSLEADFQAPAWNLGQHTLVGFGGALGCIWRDRGADRIGVLGDGGVPEELDQPCVSASSLCAHRGGLAWIGQTPTEPAAVWWCPPGAGALALSPTRAPLSPPEISVAEPITVEVGDRSVPAAFYRPRLGDWTGPDGSRPPLVVFCHGGPTSSLSLGFDPVVQMLTTRGYAVCAVDYSGSSGYGRDYRRALLGRWGLDDVDDCVAVAEELARTGRVEASAMAIRGTSAGGFTALGALVRSRRFSAGVSWYGISDLAALAATTHDFEARYTERLVGSPPKDRYAERSPIHRLDAFHGAVLLLQGEDDPVVPLAQTTALAEALAARGTRCEVLVFAGESHGFRSADTLRAAYAAELAFYDSVLLGGGEGSR